MELNHDNELTIGARPSSGVVAVVFVIWLALGPAVSLAHPQGHWTMTRDEQFEHAMALMAEGADLEGDGLLQSLAEEGHRPAEFEVFLRRRASGGSGLREWLFRASAPSRAEHQFRLAERWLNGDGIGPDPGRAALLYYLAARQGHSRAQVMLASQLERGDGVGEDADESLVWLRRAARGGSSEAQYRLGLKLSGETGRTWMELAADAGHTQAQHYLGLQFSQGGAFPTDERLALTWLERAAEGGHVVSMLLAGHMRLEGRGGARDEAAAERWLSAALAAGEERARAPLERLRPGSTTPGGSPQAGPERISIPNAEPGVTEEIGHGTGFWVSADGHLVTNHHVIDQCTEMRLSGYGPADLVGSDPVNDIALLKSDTQPGQPAVFGETEPSLGQAVMSYTLVHPGTDFEAVRPHPGEIRALERPGRDRRYFRFDARFDHGDSGAPVLDEQGRVLGLVVAKLTPPAAYRLTGVAGQPASFALRSELLTGFMELHGVPFQEAPPGSVEPVGVVRVECWY